MAPADDSPQMTSATAVPCKRALWSERDWFHRPRTRPSSKPMYIPEMIDCGTPYGRG
jgi:hypothetical protein